ncbi:conserved hypothetical protein [Perkinsus marinus ATCC 50983]|uniref:RNase H type-1 domain-containing protein n=1 Tax=Perkinsus marinus (strain ATCC 50983 / TXsc) TaxID=423536 RepID=C5LYI7_PERM5|nr:conserved hypothetical protein [Perkinsus marinus ATCC 50983]EEQ98225.1 conserved hypothetical protein [Perkinsus marinus ATCC 50983]|eukprot:XP_002765508.1 conserved hypothetical protein [Perkinsus marinus ATCC 50983]
MPPPKALTRTCTTLRELIEMLRKLLGEDIEESNFVEKNGGNQLHVRLRKHNGGVNYYPKSGKVVVDGRDGPAIAAKLSGDVNEEINLVETTAVSGEKPSLLEALPVEGVSSTAEVDDVLVEIGEGDWKWTEVYENTLWIRQSVQFDAVMELDRTCNCLNFMGPQAKRLRSNYLSAAQFLEPVQKRPRYQDGVGSQASTRSVPEVANNSIQSTPSNLPNLMLTFDGGSQGGQSSAGSGAVLYRKDGNGRFDEIAAWSLKLGPGRTNNEAEYEALCMGLDKINELIEEPANLTIQGDSKLVISQMGPSQWKVNKEELRQLKERAEQAIHGLMDRMQVTWIHTLRCNNKRADELATFGSRQPGNVGEIISH